MYVAYGRGYIANAATSAKSLKRQNSWMGVALFTDDVGYARENFGPNFDVILPLCETPAHEEYLEFLKSRKDLASLKLLPMDRLPFTKTLSIDSDTVVLGDLSEAFQKLDIYDLLLCEECLNTTANLNGQSGATGLVDTRRRDNCNAGVIFINASKAAVRTALARWPELLRLGDPNLPDAVRIIDQTVLDYMLWYPETFLPGASFSLTLLKPELYNCYCRMWMEVWESGFWTEVKIAHSWLSQYLAAAIEAGTPWEVFFSPQNPHFEYISRFRIGGGAIPASLKAQLYRLDKRRVVTLPNHLLLAAHRLVADTTPTRFDQASLKYQAGYAKQEGGGYGDLFEALLADRCAQPQMIIKLGIQNTFPSTPNRNMATGFRTGFDLEFLAELFPASTVIGITSHPHVNYAGERIETRWADYAAPQGLSAAIGDLCPDVVIEEDAGSAPEIRAAHFIVLCAHLAPAGIAVMFSAADGAAGDRMLRDLSEGLLRQAPRRYALSGWRSAAGSAIVVRRVSDGAQPEIGNLPGDDNGAMRPGLLFVRRFTADWGGRFNGDGEIRFYGDGRRRFGELLERFCARRRICRDETTLLCDLMRAAGSDKSTKHNYTLIYDFLLREQREVIQNVFEIGIGTNFPDMPSTMGAHGVPGASLRAWRTYFPAAHIFGGDVDKRVLFEEPGISTFFVDQLDRETILELWANLPDVQFDLLIDDGLHTAAANANLLIHSHHKISARGFYVVEDILSRDDLEYDKLFCDVGLHGFLLFSPNSERPDDNGIAFLQR